MGYDMSIRSDRPVNDDALLASLNTEWDAALKVRDAFPKEARGSFQEGIDDRFVAFGGTYANADPEYAKAQAEVMRISEEIDKARVSYFRLNIWGMARYRDTMEAVGMGYWPEDFPEWPRPEAYGITDTEVMGQWDAEEEGDLETLAKYQDGTYASLPPLTDEVRQACKDFRAASEAVKSAHPGETPGIPLVKFTSNDGWHVIPAECKSALQLFGEFLVAGYGTLTWEESLAAYRKADEQERKIVASNALVLRAVENTGVGHPPFNADDGDQATVLDTITEDYWLEWLRYLEVAGQHDGFEVW